ncbi:MAG: glycosyltransferase [Elusimicrobia bacterium]|nr:glycosyltransferase [Elusimicrobiota bacterium]
MKLLLVADPQAPYGEDAFCRELAARAAARGHETVLAGPQTPAQADAVLINSCQREAFLAARSAGLKTAVRLIDSFAELDEARLLPIRDVLARADRVFVPSRHLAGRASSWGAGDRVRIVPYAYDRVRANQIALVTVRASRPADFQIVAVSKFTEACRPGLELLLAAASRLRFDAHLTLVGQGPIWDEVRERASRLLPGKAMFTGALPHLKIMEFFRAAKAYVDPSGADGFPAAALYALAEGCPVVAPRFGAVTELINHGANGLLFAAADAGSLAEALVTLRSEPGLSLRLIAEGVKTVQAHSWDATIAAAFAGLEELVR